MKHIGISLRNFGQWRGRLPRAIRTDEAGRPLSSWRFQIMPYVEGFMLDLVYDARWDDSANRVFAGDRSWIFCWSAATDSSESLHTNVVAITGPGTAFDGDRAVRLGDLDPGTVLAIEIADSGTHWMEPGDLNINQVPESIVKGVDGDGVHVLFADGAVWFLRPDTPLDGLKKFFTIEGAKRHNRERVLGPHAYNR